MLPKTYDHLSTEKKWMTFWKTRKTFSSKPDPKKKAFSIVIPPPNVTGVLHIGHTLNGTIQDILARRAKMLDYNVCWVPGCDHASIATESKVVAYLKESKGIDKKDLSREEFIKYAYEWKDKYGGVIYHQLEKLGCAVDWDRASFTMDKHYHDSVIQVFIDLYKRGLLYRGKRIINWDPVAKTALSDEEVEHKTVQSKLYYIKYFVVREDGSVDKSQCITVATQRPETIMGDTAVCVHPEDEKYFSLKGKTVQIPLIHKNIPVIADEYIDKEFGTGALKVTPAHDINDYHIGMKHHLEVIDTLDDEGKLNASAQILVGEDRFVARKKIVQMLKESGNLLKEEDYTSSIGFSQRTQAVVEPKISMQWFMKMDEVCKNAMQVLEDQNIQVYPADRFMNNFRSWLNSPRDWCISRQLWWGQRIPAYYAPNGEMLVANSVEEAYEQFKKQNANLKKEDITQDEDCLDTWFSSWIWPLEVFKGLSNPNNADIKYYYPTSVLVTGPDILYFWVARMIMAGQLFLNAIPFEKVYFTGIIRDKEGRKMSKSLGNSPDLLELIEQYGSDVVRFGVMIASPAGNDLLFKDDALEQGKNFLHKLWNVLKLFEHWENDKMDTSNLPKEEKHFAIDWFENILRQYKKDIHLHFERFQISEALKLTYSLAWNEYCSHYLEWIKPTSGNKISPYCVEKSKYFFGEILHLLHPFMPFVTNEMFAILFPQTEPICLSHKLLQADETINPLSMEQGVLLQNLITTLRDYRNKKSLSFKVPLSIKILTQQKAHYEVVLPILKKMSELSHIDFLTSAEKELAGIPLGKDMLYVVIDNADALFGEEDKKKLEEQLAHLKNFLSSVEKKLANEKFVQHAQAEVLQKEQQKKTDALQKIQATELELKKYSK